MPLQTTTEAAGRNALACTECPRGSSTTHDLHAATPFPFETERSSGQRVRRQGSSCCCCSDLGHGATQPASDWDFGYRATDGFDATARLDAIVDSVDTDRVDFFEHLRRVAERLAESAASMQPSTDASDAVVLHLWQATQMVIDLAMAACLSHGRDAGPADLRAFLTQLSEDARPDQT
jgi:hypothetical protein